MGYSGEYSIQWLNEGSIYHQYVNTRYSEVLREPDFDLN